MTDILLKTDDLGILDGDFVVGESDYQNAALLIRLHPGNLKQSPLTGVGEKRLINGTLDGGLRRDVQLQLEGDGYRLKTLTVAEGKIFVDFDA